MNSVKCCKVTVMKCTSRKEAAAIVHFGKRDAGRLQFQSMSRKVYVEMVKVVIESEVDTDGAE